MQTNKLAYIVKKKKPVEVFFFFLFIVLILADQISKTSAPNIFKNYNFAFSLPLPVWSMFVIYLTILILIFNYCKKNYINFSFEIKFAWVLIFAGAFSNIIERLNLGYVKDFIYISFSKWTGVYNLADIFIIVGVIILLTKSSRQKNDF